MVSAWVLLPILLALLAWCAPCLPMPSILKDIRRFILVRLLRRPRCERLTWEDLPLDENSALHSCIGPIPPSHHCRHNLQHTSGELPCWHSNLPLFFNTAWENTERRRHYVVVPYALSRSHGYLQTDSRMLLSFLLCTAPSDRGYPEWLELDDRQDSLTVYHLSGGKFVERSLTPYEARCLILGYPPWYRRSFKTVYGFDVPHPMHNIDMLRRGGWVIAIGFQKPPYGLARDKPAPFYLYPRGWRESAMAPGFVAENGNTPLRAGVKRVIRVIEEKLEPRFRGQPIINDIQSTLKAIREFDAGGYNSRIPYFISSVDMRNWFRDTTESGAGSLSSDDVIFAMSIFDNDFSDTESFENALRRLDSRGESLLRPILIAAATGVKEVFEYERNYHRVSLPATELRARRGKIWLRDCNNEFDVHGHYSDMEDT